MLSKAASSITFKVFGMNRPGIEHRSPGPLATTLLIRPIARYTHTHTHTHTHIHIYIYIYLSNIYQPSRYQKKKRKNPRQEQEIKVSRITARGEKKKLLVKKKEKANLVRPLEKNQGIRSQLVKRKLKTFRKSCNATITKVLNTSGANFWSVPVP